MSNIKSKTHTLFDGKVVKSPLMRVVLDSARRMATSELNILLQGETGSGKSAMAKAMHGESQRKDAPFVVLDCAAVAPSMIESALFGHEKGAFTGADRARAGVFEAAADGTLFIDELTELPRDLQAKLLRALEEREFTRLGSSQPLPVRCRIITATQEDLVRLVKVGAFRRDLYFRVAVATIAIPSLRDRPEDIPAIVDELFVAAGQPRRSFALLTPAIQKVLLQHTWPGNVRELRNIVEQIAVTDQMPDLDVFHHPPEKDQPPADSTTLSLDDASFLLPYRAFKEAQVAQLERLYVVALLARAENNVSQAAKLGGMNRRYLYQLLHKYGLREFAGD